jgi:hypothetical protein
MKGFADEMSATGKPLEDEDFVSYVLAGLDQDYNSFVENVTDKEEISLGSMYSQLLATEARLDLQSTQSQSLVNALLHGVAVLIAAVVDAVEEEEALAVVLGGRRENGSSPGTKPVCQLCKQTGHTILRC